MAAVCRCRKATGFLAARISSTVRVTTSCAYESTNDRNGVEGEATQMIGGNVTSVFFAKPPAAVIAPSAPPMVDDNKFQRVVWKQQQQQQQQQQQKQQQQQQEQVYENYFGIPTVLLPSAAPDPSSVEIVRWTAPASTTSSRKEEELISGKEYPFAAMLQGSAPYIASNLCKVAVFHIYGELLLPQKHNGCSNQEKKGKQYTETLWSDIALTWLMGMKIVLVVSAWTPKKHHHHRHHHQTPSSLLYPHEYYNSLKMLNADEILQINQDAGYVRFEVERKLNKCLNLVGGGRASSDDPYAPIAEGNVVSGNFYTAKSYGCIRGQIFQHTGFAQQIHTNQIRNVLDRHDVVLLTNVGTNIYGDMVCVNGNHLAASVAVSLNAHKMIYVAIEGAVLCSKPPQEEEQKGLAREDSLPCFQTLQDIPLSFAKKMIEYHNVDTDNELPGYASFHQTGKKLEPRAVELLLHLGWSSWALERGVARDHVVNPKDGGLLEELFTSKNRENTCVYHDDEYQQQEQRFQVDSSQQLIYYDNEHDSFVDEEEWEDVIMSV